MFVVAPTTVREAADYLNTSNNTIMRWWDLCRSVCTATLDRQPPFVGTPEASAQVDEPFFLEDENITAVVCRKETLL